MYNNILIVSDNISQCQKLVPILEKYPNKTFEFATSPFSDIASFRTHLDKSVAVLDMKNVKDVNFIIDSFDLVISMHCKQIFPKNLIDHVKCINVHPGYNPINRGWYPQVFAIINNLPVGATIHEIDEHLDHGAIIARAIVEKRANDTSLSLYERITEMEIILLDRYFEQILNNTYETVMPEGEGNLFLKKDFNKLCKIELNEKLTWREAIDRLRALSHGDFRNAFYIDADTGRKVFVNISLSTDQA